MRRAGGCALLLVLAAAAGAVWWAWLPAEHSPAPAAAVDAAPPPRSTPPTRGRPARSPQGDLLARAQRLLGTPPGVSSCGPYRLVTDVGDPRWLDGCQRLASELDALYQGRFGLRPVGEPAEAIVLFAEHQGYRRFARESGVAAGYAGYALAARGLAVFYAGGQPLESFLSTLSHELTHLVHRRALGVNLPPWLSEGLADAIGDTATAAGFEPLPRHAGDRVQARRLRQAYAARRVQGLERLTALPRSAFDRGAVSFDYEQSALFVRYLLSRAELASPFRSYLAGIAAGEGPGPDRLRRALGTDWPELDRSFQAWLGVSPAGD